MNHPAELILDAVAAALEATVPSRFKVFTHRRESLAEEEDELPAYTVDFGEDTPIDSESTLDGTIASLLTVNVTGIAESADERELRKTLIEMRLLAHVAIRKNPTLELKFVTDTHYGGANPPEVDASGDAYVGELTCPWGVQYEMNINNPSE